MTDKKLKSRDQIDKKYKWNIEAMYPNEELWYEDVKEAIKLSEDLKEYSGHLTDSGKTLYKALTEKDQIFLIGERAYCYARMRQDEDNTVTKYQAMLSQITSAFATIGSNLSFFTPELLSHSKEEILGLFKEEPALETYRFLIEDMLREKDHILSAKEENILAQMGEITGGPHDIFSMLNNADIKFGEITDEDGSKVELTHGNFINFMESPNRQVRKEAFEHVYTAYKDLINTISTAYSYNVKTDVISARLRNYPSARAAALSGGNIPEEVYDNLVKVVNDYLPVLHKYTKMRKEILGVDQLHMYDVYVPLFDIPKKDIPFEEGVEIVKEALQPMGEEYVNRLSKGVSDGWIDVYENQGKTSGAYSFGSYDSMPYVLLNYTNTLKDVFTIIHELGHSMHSSYTRENQPFVYGGHSIFTAEVASTVNESLLIKHLLEKETDKEMRKYLINYYIEEFRTTLFRQTMFAEFEHIAHQEVENGGALTYEWLCTKYKELNQKYFGSAMADDEYIQYEWARIPHFYRSFYVYQYATGYSAATSISKKILQEGTPARDAYKEFLKTGESDHPVELLKIAGVDMSKPEPIIMAMETFKNLVEELEKLL